LPTSYIENMFSALKAKSYFCLPLLTVRSVSARRWVSTVSADAIGEQQKSRNSEDEEFRVLENIYPKKAQPRREMRKFIRPTMPPREKQMPVDQDWPSVWPTAKTFHPASVPLPLYQGIPATKKSAPADKYCNPELMKIPNFLHLTPPAIQRHCHALKKFCTEWPKGLETEEDMETHFPFELITNDFCHSSPSIRDGRSRIVSIRFPLSRLNLDDHARDKFLRLVGTRYDESTGKVTLVADRCPLRRQNMEYLQYLITALYYESQKKEPWEWEKKEEDMETYSWKGGPSQKTVVNTLNAIAKANKLPYLSGIPEDEIKPEHIEKIEPIETYAKAVEEIHNIGDSEDKISNYKKSTKELLGLQTSPFPDTDNDGSSDEKLEMGEKQ